MQPISCENQRDTNSGLKEYRFPVHVSNEQSHRRNIAVENKLQLSQSHTQRLIAECYNIDQWHRTHKRGEKSLFGAEIYLQVTAGQNYTCQRTASIEERSFNIAI